MSRRHRLVPVAAAVTAVLAVLANPVTSAPAGVPSGQVTVASGRFGAGQSVSQALARVAESVQTTGQVTGRTLSVVPAVAPVGRVSAPRPAQPPRRAAKVGAPLHTVPVPAGAKVVYLTFDDGPNPAATPGVLALLRAHRATATFFVVGYRAQRYPALVSAVRAAGHTIGNHTWDHRPLTTLSTHDVAQELARTRALIGDVRCMRPPYGDTDARVTKVAAAYGERSVLWDIDPTDWARPGAPAISGRVLADIHPGAIVLLHDGGGPRDQTVAATRTILSWLDAHGYSVRALPGC